jgi:8-oxo-dGTP diphosphatase
MKAYVVGIILDNTAEKVLLIRKNRPRWQIGRLNGVGGKLEEGESSYEAMVRECSEECVLLLHNWLLVDTYTDGINFTIDYFVIKTSSIEKVKSSTDELVELWCIDDLELDDVVEPTLDFIHRVRYNI